MSHLRLWTKYDPNRLKIDLCATQKHSIAGFLSEGVAGSTRGNFALFDLQAAIQWVHSNIHRFGGDCEQLTLMGHSHGAALVHLFSTSLLSIGNVSENTFHFNHTCHKFTIPCLIARQTNSA